MLFVLAQEKWRQRKSFKIVILLECQNLSLSFFLLKNFLFSFSFVSFRLVFCTSLYSRPTKEARWSWKRGPFCKASGSKLSCLRNQNYYATWFFKRDKQKRWETKNLLISKLLGLINKIKYNEIKLLFSRWWNFYCRVQLSKLYKVADLMFKWHDTFGHTFTNNFWFFENSCFRLFVILSIISFFLVDSTT